MPILNPGMLPNHTVFETLKSEIWNIPELLRRTETWHFVLSELESYNGEGLLTDLFEHLNHRLGRE